MKKINEIFVEVTSEEQHQLLCNSDLTCYGNTLNYPDLVRSKPKPGELGFLYINGKRIRYIYQTPIVDLKKRQEKTMKFLDKRYPEFLPVTFLSFLKYFRMISFASFFDILFIFLYV